MVAIIGSMYMNVFVEIKNMWKSMVRGLQNLVDVCDENDYWVIECHIVVSIEYGFEWIEDVIIL